MSIPVGHQVARLLLDIKAVNFRPDAPYTLTAGWASPVYIDCRWVISFPAVRKKIAHLANAMLDDAIGFAHIDAIAGGETAGIPYAAWIAAGKDKPMVYVRKKPKGFGRGARIEGSLTPGQRVLLVEDLATDGGSKISFVDAIRDVDGVISDAFVVFYYGVFAGTLDMLREKGVALHYLCTWQDVLAQAEAGGDFSAAAIAEVKVFLEDPVGWSAAHGGRGR